jgi:prophage regulatory protein
MIDKFASRKSLTPAASVKAHAFTPKDRRKDRLLRIKSVIARTGLSRSTIDRREVKGTFPKRQQIGPRCIGWYESDIDDFVAAPLSYRSP